MRNELGGFQLLRFSDCYCSLAYNLAHHNRLRVHFNPSCFIPLISGPQTQATWSKGKKGIAFTEWLPSAHGGARCYSQSHFISTSHTAQ